MIFTTICFTSLKMLVDFDSSEDEFSSCKVTLGFNSLTYVTNSTIKGFKFKNCFHVCNDNDKVTFKLNVS